MYKIDFITTLDYHTSFGFTWRIVRFLVSTTQIIGEFGRPHNFFPKVSRFQNRVKFAKRCPNIPQAPMNRFMSQKGHP